MATNYYDSFVKKLKEIFMMDHAELDFGIYRIMNQKRQDIMHFLEHELLPQVKEVLNGAGAGDTASIKAQMREMEQQAASYGTSADNNPVYQQLKAKLEASGDTAALQNEVFSHLVTFFSRYYDNGDFISKRRYKDNTYAIPYNGEEVKLHWANADQYYIKSSEYFRDYSFVLPTSRRKVHFVLKDASTEQNNNKTANNMERRFALYKPKTEGEKFYEVNGDELNIFFTYELMSKGTKQNDLMAEAFDSIKDIIPLDFSELLTVKSPTDKNANRTLLEKHLTDYTARNSFDYFIHKDLGGFLRRELDFYIKNEVMLLDDLDVQHIASQLNIIKAIKLVGEKIIRMLAQLEDFQKKLWLKKKFVVQSDYCITLDRVPRELYPEILANDRQREEWKDLFAIDEITGDLLNVGYSVPLTMEFLEQNPFLVLDTAFFSKQFKHKLVASMENVDRDCNGLLINSENFQALELLQEKYKKSVKCVYIDPPYNTGSDGFTYKDNYQHSSWLSLNENRYVAAKKLISDDGGIFTSIDDPEQAKLIMLEQSIFGADNFVNNIIWQKKYSLQSDASFFSDNHDFITCFAKNKSNYSINLLSRSEESNKYYKYDDHDGRGLWRSDNVLVRSFSPSGVFPIRNPNTGVDYYPPEGSCYRFSRETAERYIQENRFYFGKDGKGAPQLKRYLSEVKQGITPVTIWLRNEVGDTQEGANIVSDLFGNKVFTSPKVPRLLQRVIQLASEDSSLILDYFAGSGTTGHAIINLNRDNKGNRKYGLVEVNDYFNSVTKPRIEKVIHSPDWKDGKPVSRQGISQCFKYMRLEQYEDTLNNLKIKEQQTMAQFDEGSGFKESYMLEYMLDVEMRDSLLNLKMFENPFAMTLKTTKDNELVDTEVNMVETFNYLIGLNVETEDWYRDENICVVQGHTHRDNLHTLVIWRNCKEINNEQLNQFFERMDFRTRDSEFDLIYVNGDNLLPNLRRDEDNWKVVLIEEEFTKRMFETE